MAIEQILIDVFQNFGISLSAGAFLEFIKNYHQSKTTDTIEEFRDEIQNFLNINGVTMQAETLIDAFAQKGILVINNSHLSSVEQITIGAGQNSQFSFGNNSTSTTDKTKIVTGQGAQIAGGNSAIVQNPDGSISFHVGQDKQ